MSVFMLIGRVTPCNFKYNPQALHKHSLFKPRRHRGVTVVWQLKQGPVNSAESLEYRFICVGRFLSINDDEGAVRCACDAASDGTEAKMGSVVVVVKSKLEKSVRNMSAGCKNAPSVVVPSIIARSR